MRCSKKEAQRLRSLILDGIAGRFNQQVQAPVVVAAPAPAVVHAGPGAHEQLRNLAALLAEGLLTKEEYLSKKAELLSRM